VVLAVLSCGLLGCASTQATVSTGPAGQEAGAVAGPTGSPERTVARSPTVTPVVPAPTTTTTPTPTPTAAPTPTVHSDGAPRQALLTIPAIGIRALPVVPYEGWTDDGPGTAIQDGGVAASPFGERGGAGPGGIGNYQVTAHRLSSTQAFLDLPDLVNGARVYVDVQGTRYVYEVRDTRRTSFRSAQSLAAQRAAVPGRPGDEPTEAYLTLSTCATPEDRAAGNHWSDRYGNPEHRIDKIGVLISSGPVSS
jgi:sortase A